MDSSSIISQIKGAGSFFASQARIGTTSELLEQSKASLAKSLVTQIGQLCTLDVEGAAVLIATLAESASFDNEQKTMIASAVSSKVSQPTVAHGDPTGTQSLLNPGYVTKADWDVFEEAQANLTKKVVVVERRLQHMFEALEQTTNYETCAAFSLKALDVCDCLGPDMVVFNVCRRRTRYSHDKGCHCSCGLAFPGRMWRQPFPNRWRFKCTVDWKPPA